MREDKWLRRPASVNGCSEKQGESMTATWTAPRTWVDDELVSAALLNPHLRDNLEFLYQAAYNGFILIRDEKANNTDGGTFTSGAWQTRTLNTEVLDPGGFASLLSNQITLLAGRYRVWISCPAYGVTEHQARLQNISDGATTLYGTSEYSNSGYLTATHSLIVGEFVITQSKIFEVQHRCGATYANEGFGRACAFGNTEVYTIAMFQKVGS